MLPELLSTTGSQTGRMVFAACVRCAACDNRRPYFQRLFGVLVTASVDVLNACQTLIDPNTGKDFVSQKSIRNVKVDGDTVSLELVLGYPAQSQHDAFREQIIGAVRALPGVGKVNVQVHTDIVAHGVQRGVKLIPGVKNIVAVASGKGGVGKSTTAVNLALALAAEGARVGMLDADIYGPSQPTMLGIEGKPESHDGQMLEPMWHYGVQAMSVGFLIDPDTPMVWRGPMVTSALEQLLNQTRWQELDYLVVDLPPGTGDIQLTLSQKVPVTGAVIVTTPQDIALLDARKGLKMFEKVGICGSGGGEKMCADYGTELLGSLPLDIKIREQADSGSPTVVADPQGPISALYKAIARKVAIKVAEKAADMSAKFPKIVVQNT
jgi:ATP-binding protein involved in chromosome partitioning